MAMWLFWLIAMLSALLALFISVIKHDYASSCLFIIFIGILIYILYLGLHK